MSVCRCVWLLFMTAVVVMSTCDGSGVSNSVISSSSGSSSSFSVSGTGSSHSSSSVHADGSGSVGSVYQSQGGVVSLKCGPGDSIVWYKVNDDKSKTELSSKNGATHAGPRIKVEYTNQGSVLTISNTKEEDSGTYICETGMTAQRKTHQYTITVGSGSGMQTASLLTIGLLLSLVLTF